MQRNPWEVRVEAERLIGKDRVPTDILEDLIAQFGDDDEEPALGTPEWVRERALRGLVALKESDPDVVYEVLTTLSEYEAS